MQLVPIYFRLDGHHIRFNVRNAATCGPQESPEQFRDLIARVGGYGDYFCNLSRPLHNKITARTEHQQV